MDGCPDTLGHGLGSLRRDGGEGFQGFVGHVEKLLLDAVGVGDHAAKIHVGAAGNGGEGGADHAAGAAFGGGQGAPPFSPGQIGVRLLLLQSSSYFTVTFSVLARARSTNDSTSSAASAASTCWSSGFVLGCRGVKTVQQSS